MSNYRDQDGASPTESQGSLAKAIARYQQGDQSELGEIVFGFYTRLVAIAHAKLRKAPNLQSVTDGEGAVSSAMGSYWRAMGDGKFRDMQHRNELMGLLVKMVERKVAHQIRKLTSAKAGAGKVINEPGDGLDLEGREPSPAEAALEREAQAHLERVLEQWRNYMTENGLLDVAELVLAGEGYREIAGALGVGENKARRMITLANALTREFGQEDKP
jgi:hypothetical protein